MRIMPLSGHLKSMGCYRYWGLLICIPLITMFTCLTPFFVISLLTCCWAVRTGIWSKKDLMMYGQLFKQCWSWSPDQVCARILPTSPYRRIILMLSGQCVGCSHTQRSCPAGSSLPGLSWLPEPRPLLLRWETEVSLPIVLPFCNQMENNNKKKKNCRAWILPTIWLNHKQIKGKMKRIPGEVFINPQDWMTASEIANRANRSKCNTLSSDFWKFMENRWGARGFQSNKIQHSTEL